MTVFQSLLNHNFAVERRVRTLDHQGGWLINYSPINAILGRLRPASSAEIIAAQQEQRRLSHSFYCVAVEGIVCGDRIPGKGVRGDVVPMCDRSRADSYEKSKRVEIQAAVAEAGS